MNYTGEEHHEEDTVASDIVEPRRFPGGLRLQPHKENATAEPIAILPVPEKLILPLQQHLGAPALPVVKPGDNVLRGQLIAEPGDLLSAALHAPSSGRVTAIQSLPLPHPSGLYGDCIVIETDGRDTAANMSGYDSNNLPDAAQLLTCIRNAGIVGLGGATFPTDIKLDLGQTHNIDTLILNGAECEPYISCDDRLMREHADDVVAGARILLDALGIRHCSIAIEDNKPQSHAAMENAIANAGDDRLSLESVPSIYPEGGERQLIQVLTGKEVPAGGLPIDLGLMCLNVGTAAAITAAILHGEPLISRVVTVTGMGVAKPRNLLVRIGTPISELVRFCGGYTPAAERLIMGGPMMGFSLPDDALPVTKACNCILIAGEDEIQLEQEAQPCIRCGDCAEVCPASLLPQQLYWYTKAHDFDRVEDHDLFDCIECGCCAYVCPSHIPLVQYYRYAKSTIRAQRRQRLKADEARQRHENRNRRLQHEQAELTARREQKQRLLESGASQSDAAKRAEIEAILDRARAKQPSPEPDDGARHK